MKEFSDFRYIVAAHKRIAPYIHKTPILSSRFIDEIADAQLFFKCENFQKTGSFKFRGATNSVLSLSPDTYREGVCTHSSGNHAAALSLAARNKDISAQIVMFRTTPSVKINAVKAYGGNIIFCEPTLQARIDTLQKIVTETNAKEIHSSDYFPTIYGQGTTAKELLEEVELDILIVPVGGGGLLSGTVIAAKTLSPNIKVIGAEPKEADDAFRSMKSGKLIPSKNPKTICDGLITSLSERTFSIIQGYVDDIFTAGEETIIQAMQYIWERMKIIVEPSSSVPLAVMLENKLFFQQKRVGIILSGGNIDLQHLPF